MAGLPFTDCDIELPRTAPEQRDLLFGRSNRFLLNAGLVEWRDLVGRQSIVEFDSVVYNNGLSLEAILAARVPEDEARPCWQRVLARRIEDEKRRESLDKLKIAGITLGIDRG